MSDVVTPDVLSGMTVTGDNLREAAATVVRGSGATIEAVNAALAARGVAPLNPGSKDYAENRKDVLTRDSNFMAKYSAGDPEAIAKLYAADLAVINGKGGLLDRAPGANDPAYDAVRREVGHNVSDAATYTTYANELTGLASSIGMPPASAASLAQDHFTAIRTTAGMSPDELSYWAEREAATFHAALGENAEQKLAEASKTLSARSGRKLDLNAIARTNGARVAVNLYFQSMSLKGTK